MTKYYKHQPQNLINLGKTTIVPDDLNIIQKDAEKMNKYRDLQIEV